MTSTGAWAAAIAVTLGAMLSGCEGTRCGGNERDEAADAPVLLSFYMLDETRQIPDDPWTVVFGAEFEDPDANLAAGAAEFYLNANPEPATQPMDQVFRQSGIAAGEPRGAFWATLRFAEETVDDGTRVRLGLQLIDGAELRSNCFTLELAFDVNPLGAGVLPLGQALRCTELDP